MKGDMSDLDVRGVFWFGKQSIFPEPRVQEVINEGFREDSRRRREVREGNLVMGIWGVDKVVLFGAKSAEFNTMNSHILELGKLISAAKVRQRKLGGVKISRRMRTQGNGLLKNARYKMFRARPKDGGKTDEKRGRRAILLSNGVEPRDGKGPQCDFSRSKRENEKPIPRRS